MGNVLRIQWLRVVILLHNIELIVLDLFPMIVEVLLNPIDLLLFNNRQRLEQQHPLLVGFLYDKMHDDRGYDNRHQLTQINNEDISLQGIFLLLVVLIDIILNHIFHLLDIINDFCDELREVQLPCRLGGGFNREGLKIRRQRSRLITDLIVFVHQQPDIVIEFVDLTIGVLYLNKQLLEGPLIGEESFPDCGVGGEFVVVNGE